MVNSEMEQQQRVMCRSLFPISRVLRPSVPDMTEPALYLVMVAFSAGDSIIMARCGLNKMKKIEMLHLPYWGYQMQ